MRLRTATVLGRVLALVLATATAGVACGEVKLDVVTRVGAEGTGGNGADPPGLCSAGKVRCGDQCVYIEADPRHCGTCGRQCGANEVCSRGICAMGCDDPFSACFAGCVDLLSDDEHCGECGTVCGDGDACVDGVCTCVTRDCPCPTDWTRCGDECVKTQSDETHCGGCGNTCPPEWSCVDGACKCGPARTNCFGDCVVLLSDDEHCGSCGAACPAGQTCGGGRCVDE